MIAHGELKIVCIWNRELFLNIREDANVLKGYYDFASLVVSIEQRLSLCDMLTDILSRVIFSNPLARNDTVENIRLVFRVRSVPRVNVLHQYFSRQLSVLDLLGGAQQRRELPERLHIAERGLIGQL